MGPIWARGVLAAGLLGALAAGLLASCDDGPAQGDMLSITRDRGPELALDGTPGDDLADVDLQGGEGPLPDAPAADGPRDDAPLDGAIPDAPTGDGLPPPPPGASCAGPQTLSLGVFGTVTVSGATTGAADEFPLVSCGNPLGPWDGPQVYYRLTLTAGQQYKAVLSSTFDAALYAFPAATACDAAAINTACTSPLPLAVDNVYSSDTIGSSALERVRIAPTTTADWILVVDSYSPNVHGSFTLTVSQVPPVTNGSCAAAQGITLTPAGSVTLSGDTSGATDEFAAVSCGGDLDAMVGPQAYFKVGLEAAKKYQVLLSADFDGALYAFPAATACAAADIDAACQNPIPPSTEHFFNADASAGPDEALRLAPGTTGEWVIAVDSWKRTAYGSFTLTVYEISPAANGTCATAQPLAFGGGAATVQGHTAGATDEFGGKITCGGFDALDGPQLYYRWSVAGGTVYRLSLTPSFSAHLYLFPASAGCQAAAINTACASSGTSGARLGPIASGATGKLTFSPASTGDYLVAIDAADPSVSGPFTLAVEAFTPPAHAHCASPQDVPLTGSPTTVSGDTGAATNEFDLGVTCGVPATTFDGAQLYFRLSLTAATVYTLAVTPAGWDAALYAVPADTACSGAAIDAACAAHLADKFYVDGQETLTLTPSSDGDWLVVVDSFTPAQAGPFNLNIGW